MNPEVNLKGSGLNVSTIKPTVNEDIAESSKKDVPKYCSKQKQNEELDEQKLTNDPPCEKDVDGQNSNEESKEIDNVGTSEKTHGPKTQENKDLNKEMSTSGEGFGEFLPPRIAHDASGNASKALLENIGFELVMQYNEDKQRYQKNLTEPIPNGRDVSDTEEVIKHWFRNTLFKERQRNKDSPYNFSNPPITTLEDIYGSKRSSRTRFTDYQLRVLQDFFDANAYPKDDEFEQLSNLLNLSTRVIVVWFQNARQKPLPLAPAYALPCPKLLSHLTVPRPSCRHAYYAV
uniref:Homeobox domain-containing protein n=1 Tax=Cyprinus carpio TaxID=7962 RepID=A0A8C2FHC8_CYPCA